MKTYKAPHEKLTDEELKDVFNVLENNHRVMKENLSSYIEVHDNYMNKLAHHLFPDRFSIGEVSMGELSDIFIKAYPEYASTEMTDENS